MKVYLLFYRSAGTVSEKFITVKRSVEDLTEIAKLNYDGLRVYFQDLQPVPTTENCLYIVEKSI